MPDPTYPRLGWPDWPGTQEPAPETLGAGIVAQIAGQAPPQAPRAGPLPHGTYVPGHANADPETLAAYWQQLGLLKSMTKGLRPDLAQQLARQYELDVRLNPDVNPETLGQIVAGYGPTLTSAFQQSAQLDQIDKDEQSSIADLMAAWQASQGMIDQQVAGQQSQMMAAQQMIGPLMQRYTADSTQNAQIAGDQMRQYQQYLPPEAAALVGALADQQQGQAGRMATAYQASAQAIPAINSLAAARQYQDSLQQQQMDVMAQLTQLRESARQRRSEAMTPVAAPSADFAAQLAALGG